ncbi:MAG: glycosyltransferase [Solirubrobacteraceae bacterium]|nr:glycosyltransferase [Solirubrobacteraceae bacterium]
MSQPRVSVCIRTVNRPAALRTAVASVLAQRFDDFELIISSDGPLASELVGAFSDPRVRVSEHPGPPSATANLVHAFSLARGEYLALLDDDDAWDPEFLSTLVPVLDRDPTLGVAFCDYVMLAGTETIRRPWPFPTGDQAGVVVALLDRSIPPAAAVLRREAYLDGEQVLPLEPHLAGAISIWLRTAQRGWGFHHVDRELVQYRLHAGQMSWTGNTAARYAATLERLAFDSPQAEQIRRARLTESYLTQAGIRLRRGDWPGARRYVRHARSHGGLFALRNLIAVTGVRRMVARRLPQHPRLLRAGLPLWGRIRPRLG